MWLLLGGAGGTIALLLVLVAICINKQGRRRDLGDAHVIITGGSSGMGLEVAKKLAAGPEPKPRITLIARNRQKLESAATQVRLNNESVSVIGLSYDLTLAANAYHAVEAAERLHGPVHILINCAGAASPGYFEQMDPKLLEEQMQMNYLTTAFMTQAVAKCMVRTKADKGRAILTVASTAGMLGLFGYAAYAPTKAAVANLMACLYFELRPYDINVTTFFAPDTDTPGFANEQLTKPLETLLTVSSSMLHPPADVASSILATLKAGKHRGYHDFESRLLGLLSSGTGPGVTVLDLLCPPVLKIIMQYTIAGWNRTIGQEFLKKQKRA